MACRTVLCFSAVAGFLSVDMHCGAASLRGTGSGDSDERNPATITVNPQSQPHGSAPAEKTSFPEHIEAAMAQFAQNLNELERDSKSNKRRHHWNSRCMKCKNYDKHLDAIRDIREETLFSKRAVIAMEQAEEDLGKWADKSEKDWKKPKFAKALKAAEVLKKFFGKENKSPARPDSSLRNEPRGDAAHDAQVHATRAKERNGSLQNEPLGDAAHRAQVRTTTAKAREGERLIKADAKKARNDRQRAHIQDAERSFHAHNDSRRLTRLHGKIDNEETKQNSEFRLNSLEQERNFEMNMQDTLWALELERRRDAEDAEKAELDLKEDLEKKKADAKAKNEAKFTELEEGVANAVYDRKPGLQAKLDRLDAENKEQLREYRLLQKRWATISARIDQSEESEEEEE